MPTWDDLRGRVAIVTGASSGIGAAVATRFGHEGMRVVLAARRADALAAVAAAVHAAGGEALVVPTDVRDPAAVERLAAVAREAWGRIDALVANAGIGARGALVDLSAEQIRAVVEVNLVGAILSVRAVLPTMLAQRDGRILAVSSVAGRLAGPGSGLYSATKAGLLAFSDGLRRGLAASGVAVSVLVPGFIDTPMPRRQPPPWMMAPVSVVAEAAVRILRRPRREAIVPGWYRLPIAVNAWLPGLVDLLATRYMPARYREPGPPR